VSDEHLLAFYVRNGIIRLKVYLGYCQRALLDKLSVDQLFKFYTASPEHALHSVLTQACHLYLFRTK